MTLVQDKTFVLFLVPFNSFLLGDLLEVTFILKISTLANKFERISYLPTLDLSFPNRCALEYRSRSYLEEFKLWI